MFLTAHATVGAAIAHSTLSPWVVFLLAFASHFLVDAIPHGDQGLGAAPTHKERVKKLLVIISIDLGTLTLLTTYLLLTKAIERPLVTAIAMLCSMAPDGLHGLSELTGWRRVAWMARCQSWFHIHTHFPRVVVAFPVGMIVQIFFTLLVIGITF